MKADESQSKKQQFGIWLGLPPGSREPPSQIELAAQLGVTEQSLTTWKRDPIVQEIAKNALQLMALGHNLEIWNSTIEKAKEGNVMAQRLYYDLTNQLRQKETKGIPGKFVVEYVTDSGTES